MAETPVNPPQVPLLDRMALEEQYGGYTPAGIPEPLPNIPFRGLSTQDVGVVNLCLHFRHLDASVRSSNKGLQGGSIRRSLWRID